jgi:hypothetical protein
MPDTRGPVRIVVHAGFHKTGTTTVQQTLRQNARILWPVMALGLRPKLVPILQAARGYSTWRDPLSLMKFGDRVDHYLAGLNLSANRMLCLSAEELSGHLPGRDTVPDYGAAPALMREFAQVAQARFGPALDLCFYFSTRRPDAWLQSAWAEHVKASRMTRDLPRFMTETRPAANLPAVVNAIRTAVSPHQVHSTALEDTAPLPFGPAQPLIELLALPPRRAAQLEPVTRPANTSLPADILDQMLALNRSDLPRPAINAAKAALLAQKPA